MVASHMEWLAAALFAGAILHTFSVGQLRHWARKYPEGSILENLFHFLGEVEIVFALWATVLIAALYATAGAIEVTTWLESLSFTEPLFVGIIMVIAATRPILDLADRVIQRVGGALKMPSAQGVYFSALLIGPLLGSFITEPAAMTVTALILKRRVYDAGVSLRVMYLTLGTLFVNISIGGTLTHFAAPPVVMVAERWGWSSSTLFYAFGWKAACAVLLNAALATKLCWNELARSSGNPSAATTAPLVDRPITSPPLLVRLPVWLTLMHCAALGWTILFAHSSVLCVGGFLLFLGLLKVTDEYQTPLKLREGLGVGIFLAGLVLLGSAQRWWLEPLITSLEAHWLFWGATLLTAVTDNAALTYLGSLVPDLSEAAKHALVAGAVAGGGLTVIANAPNPVGYGILNPSFGKDGISAIRLLCAALMPTVIAIIALRCLPSFVDL